MYIFLPNTSTADVSPFSTSAFAHDPLLIRCRPHFSAIQARNVICMRLPGWFAGLLVSFLLAAEYRQRFADADALLPVDFRFLLRSCSISALTGVSVKILLFPLLGRFPLVTFLAGALGYGLIISGVTTATVLWAWQCQQNISA